MANATLEERLAILEEELEKVKSQIAAEKTQDCTPWYEKIFGTFADSTEYEEAMRLGREYRESLRPKEDQESAA